MAGFTVDCHVHITPPGVIGAVEDYRGRDEYFKLLTDSPRNRFATGEEVVAEMDRHGVNKAVVFGFAFKDMGLCREVNDYVMDTVSRYSHRLIGLAVVNPLASGLEKELERCRAGGLQGVGELFPEGQGFDITRREDMGPLAGLCMELDWPVYIHTNEPVGHDYRGKTGTTPEKACALAEGNPGLKIVLAHWGGGLWVYELMPELRKALKDVYYDTAATPFLYTPEIYRTAKAAGVTDKILLGSDFPLISPAGYIAGLEESGLEVADIVKIRGGNAGRLFSFEKDFHKPVVK